jgi:hypothetical protein
VSATPIKHEDEPALSAKAVKSYAEAAKIIDELIRRWLLDLKDLFDREGKKTAETIRKELADLHFDSTEFRRILQQIASGNAQKEQVNEVASLLQNTAGSVSGVLFGMLDEHKTFIDERYGAGFWNKLETQVRGIKLHIREKLEELCNTKTSNTERQKLAKQLLVEIEQFNENLALFRDAIVPPARPTHNVQ